jgi:FlaA1/EpsC-like NDP-sugar epimerase
MKIKVRIFALALTDMVLLNISVIAAFLLRFDGRLDTGLPDFFMDMMYFMVVNTVLKMTCLYFFKLYSSLWRYASIYEMVSIIGAAFFSNSAMLSYKFIADIKIPGSMLVTITFIDILLIGGIRFSYRVLRRINYSKKIFNNSTKRVLIVGNGEPGAAVIKELNQHPELKIKPVAIVDEDIEKMGRKINGVPIIGKFTDILDVVYKKKIDEIIITIPLTNSKSTNQIYNECLKTHCKVKILPSASQLIDGSVSVKRIRDVSIEDLLGRESVNLDTEMISSYLRDRVVLVTGGGGSIGSELCRQIASFNPRQLVILDNYENNAFYVYNELICDHPGLNTSLIIANIRDRKRLHNIFEKYSPDVVFHAAAHKHVPLMEDNPGEAIKNNIFGTLNVAECSSLTGVKKFVLISTDKAVNPTSIMGATKRIAEMIIQSLSEQSKTEFVAVRFGNVLGSNGSIIPLFKKQIEKGGPIKITHPQVTRFFMTVTEAVQLVMEAGTIAKGGEIFVLDMGEPVKICDLAKNLIKLSGFEPDTDIKIEFTGLRPGEKLNEELFLVDEMMKATTKNKIYVIQSVFTGFNELRSKIEGFESINMDDRDEVINYIHGIVPAYKNPSEEQISSDTCDQGGENE